MLPDDQAAMLRQLEQVLATRPHADLSVQPDLCHGVLAWDGASWLDPRLENGQGELLAGVFALVQAMPEDVELGSTSATATGSTGSDGPDARGGG